MNFSILTDLPASILILAICITLFAGTVKGAIGFALPLIMISGLSSIMDPQLAVAGIIIPVVVSNMLQVFRTGVAPALAALKDVWRYVVIVCISILIFAQVVPLMSQRVFYFVLGVPVVILALIQLLGVRLVIPQERRRAGEVISAIVSGFLGGMAGTWGPTTVLYLLAIEMPKAKQMVVQGVIYGSGAIALFLAHVYSGVLNGASATFSGVLLIPAVIGMWIGFKIQDRMNQAAFRKATLVMLTLAGLNLLRKGFIG